MEDRHIPLQDALIHALAGLGEKEGMEDQELLWKNGDAGVRVEGVQARARHPHLRLSGLREGLADKHWEVRKEALELLRDGPYHQELAPEVAECLQNDRSREVRAEAFELATTLPPDDRFIPGLAAFLAHADETIRDRASHHIRRTACQDAAKLQPVLNLLTHPEAETRNQAQMALRYPNRVPEVLDALLKRLEAADPRSRRLLSPTLGCCQDERRNDALRKALDDDNRDVSISAAYAMAYTGDRDLRPDLETLLYSEDNRYASAAILGLEIMGATDMIRPLRAMLGENAPPETDEDDYPDYGPDGDG